MAIRQSRTSPTGLEMQVFVGRFLEWREVTQIERTVMKPPYPYARCYITTHWPKLNENEACEFIFGELAPHIISKAISDKY